MSSDSAHEAVTIWIQRYLKHEGQTAGQFFGPLVRQSLDEVIDGPRTGRWELDQLSKTEKTYVGTKVEIIVRAALELDSGSKLDAVIAGQEVDIKWSQSLSWMIGPENVNELVLGCGTNKDQSSFSVGVFRASSELLRGGVNRDKKVGLTAASLRDRIHWLVRSEPLASNFVAALPSKIRTAIFAETSAQSRVRALVSLVQNTPIPRETFLTVAGNKFDPMRRLRQDAGKENPLGGMRVLSTKMNGPLLKALGFKNLPKDHWISVSADRLANMDIGN